MIVNLNTLYLKTKKLSVLLVEDHTPSREEMHEILTELFGTVVSEADGEKALGTYRQYREEQRTFDLVITDIQMPHMNGVSLAHAIKALEKEQAIIVLSAYPESQYLLDLINIGLSQFITKPINHERFLEVLSDVATSITEKRYHESSHSPSIHHLKEDLIWDSQRRLLKHNEKLIDLSRNELIFIESLAKNGEQITTTQALLETFYCNGIDINENGIRNLVLRLRKKLPENTIHTVYGMGYKLHS
jgi:DNA-binding response OmpR family regulator